MKSADVFIAADGRLRAGWRFLLFIPVFALLALILSAPLALLDGFKRPGEDFELRVMVFGLTAGLSAALAAYILLRWVDRRSFRTLGLWFYPGWGREFGLGLAGGFGLLSVVVGCLWVGGQLQFRGSGMDAVGVLRGAGWYFLLFLPPAAFEELLFRGYPFQRLVEGVGRFFAVFLLSFVFGLVHLSNPSATPLSTANTALIGILLAVGYLKTRGLWLPLGFHLAWNFFLGFVYSLPVSGIVLSQKMFTVTVGEPAWLSGGDYGPEASILTTGVVLVAAAWLARTRRLGVSLAMARHLVQDGTGQAKELESEVARREA